jgi:UDP-glucose 4-epimerase
MKILCTGGAGFIGSHIVDSLLAKGHNVTTLDNLTTGTARNINLQAKFIRKDITEDLSGVFEKGKFDCVYHCAAQINLRDSIINPTKDAQTNILGSINLLEQSYKHGCKFIFSSTGGAIYSASEDLPWHELSAAMPMSPYALSKLTVERYIRMFHNLHNLDYVILRYSNVYGPRQNAHGEAGVIAIFMDKIKRGKDLVIFGSGEQTRDYIYVDDVVSANLLALTLDNGIYNVSTGTELSVNEVARKVVAASGRTAQITFAEEIVGELKHSCLSSNKLQALGWSPKVDIDDGIKKAI